MKFKVFCPAIKGGLSLVAVALPLWGGPAQGGQPGLTILGKPATAPPPPIAEAAPLQGRVLVVSRLETTLSSQIPAVIQTIAVDHGNRFEAGQVLVTMDCQVLQAELTKSRMELEAEEQTDQANRKLWNYKSISELEVAVSASRVKKAKAQVTLAMAKTAMCQVKAPFAGRVVKRKASPHQFVGEGSAMLDILDDVNLRLQMVAPSAWITWIKPGLVFEVMVDETGKKYAATVETLGARVDPASQTFEVWANLSGQYPELLPGMSGTALFGKP